MTRVGRLGVLAVVACVVLWGGAAAATAAPLTATSDAPTNTAATSTLQEANATVTFDDQTVNDTTVTVANVTLPEGGYVTIHDSSLLDGNATGSVVGVSDYLEPGTHENVTVALYQDVPGADFNNTTAPNGTATFIAMPHMETSDAMGDAAGNDTGNQTNGNATDAPAAGNQTDTPAAANQTDAPAANQTYDFVATNGSEDGPYTTNGEAVVDDAEITFGGDGPMEPQQPTRGFIVEGLDAPNATSPGENLTVTAQIENTGDETRTEMVSFRLEGQGLDLVFRQEATLGAGVSTTVTFDVDTSLLMEGQYIHGVTTQNSSSFAVLNVTAAGGTPSENGPADNGTDGAPGNGTDAPGNGTDAPGNDTAGNDTDNGAPAEQATVTFTDQESDGFNVTVDSVTLPDGGYVTIHDTSLLEGDVTGSVLGVSNYLQPGTHENVTFTMFEVPDGFYDRIRLMGTETLIAMPHMETTGDTFYNFLASNGTEDGPYTVDGEAVTATANVTVTDGDVTDAPGNDSA